jgi:hypothetical protein
MLVIVIDSHCFFAGSPACLSARGDSIGIWPSHSWGWFVTLKPLKQLINMKLRDKEIYSNYLRKRFAAEVNN